MDVFFLSALDEHPVERDLIGRMILAYGEIEFTLMDAVAACLNNNTMTALKALYRLRSEANRLDVADALVRPTMERNGLGGAWKDAHDAVSRCKTIRNQFAHCQWLSDKGVLRFASFDEAAKKSGVDGTMSFRPINAVTLRDQSSYFTYAEHLVLFASDQLRIKLQLSRVYASGVRKPAKVLPPKLDSRAEERSRR